MSDVIINAKVGVSDVNNGAVVVFAQETGEYKKINPQINQYVSSGALYSKYEDKFLPYYDEQGNNGGRYKSLLFTTNSTSESFEVKGLTWMSAIGNFGSGVLNIQTSFDNGANYNTIHSFAFASGDYNARLLEFPQSSLVRAVLSGASNPSGTLQVKY